MIDSQMSNETCPTPPVAAAASGSPCAGEQVHGLTFGSPSPVGRGQLFCGVRIATLSILLLLLWTPSAGSCAEQEGTIESKKELLPSGEGEELTRKMCGGSCHPLGAFTGFRRSRAAWEDVVKMMVEEGMAVQREESAVIVRYLAKVFGLDSPPLTDINRAGVEDLKKFPGLEEEAVKRLLDYRDQRGGLESIDEIREIIGSEMFDKVKGYLIVK